MSGKMKKLFIACALLVSMGASAQELPCKANYDDGRCYERYSEDSDGQIHGKYIKYWEDGKVYENATYSHGKLHGPYKQLSRSGKEWYNGNYVNGEKEGSWMEFNRYLYYTKDWTVSNTSPINSLAQAQQIYKEVMAQRQADKAKQEAEELARKEQEAAAELARKEKEAAEEREYLEEVKRERIEKAAKLAEENKRCQGIEQKFGYLVSGCVEGFESFHIFTLQVKANTENIAKIKKTDKFFPTLSLASSNVFKPMEITLLDYASQAELEKDLSALGKDPAIGTKYKKSQVYITPYVKESGKQYYFYFVAAQRYDAQYSFTPSVYFQTVLPQVDPVGQIDLGEGKLYVIFFTSEEALSEAISK